jgi:hypothetical protein
MGDGTHDALGGHIDLQGWSSRPYADAASAQPPERHLAAVHGTVDNHFNQDSHLISRDLTVLDAKAN